MSNTSFQHSIEKSTLVAVQCKLRELNEVLDQCLAEDNSEVGLPEMLRNMLNENDLAIQLLNTPLEIQDDLADTIAYTNNADKPLSKEQLAAIDNCFALIDKYN